MTDQPEEEEAQEAQAPQEPTAPADPGPLSRAKWKVRLAVAIFAIVLVLVTGEGLARLSVKREVPLWLEHPLYFTVASPNVKITVPSAEGVFEYETNLEGFRGKAMKTRARPKDVYRIVFLGDEATLAASTPEERTFAGLIESGLEAKRTTDDLKIECVNAATPGFYAPLHLAALTHRVLPLEPDMVVLMSSANDVRAAIASHWDEEGSAFATRVEPPTFPDWLCTVSDLAFAIRKFGRAHGMAVTPKVRTPVTALGDPDPAADPARGLVLYRRSLRMMGAASQDVRADLVFLTQPTLYKDPITPEEAAHLPGGASDQMRKGIDLYNETLRSEAPRDRARLVDLASLMTRDLEHLKDDVTLTARGHEVAAHAFLEEIFKDKPATRR